MDVELDLSDGAWPARQDSRDNVTHVLRVRKESMRAMSWGRRWHWQVGVGWRRDEKRDRLVSQTRGERLLVLCALNLSTRWEEKNGA